MTDLRLATLDATHRELGRLHTRIAELEGDQRRVSFDRLRECEERMNLETRISELEADSVKIPGYERRVAELEAELDHARCKWDDWMTRAREAEARLAAVIAAMEIWQRGDDPDGWSPEALIRSIRAAATGDTK